ncbi:hypothetical protein [Phenylobacterium sp.]|uniref:hypothetical protein n=1 Tax=Phenylobacterium sp. TaxID=1871053 RepID=UPI00396CCCE7
MHDAPMGPKAPRSAVLAAEVRTEDGELHLFVAVDRTSKYAFARRVKRATEGARAFLDELVAAVPHQIHTAPTDNGIQFADLPKNRAGPTKPSAGPGLSPNGGRPAKPPGTTRPCRRPRRR